jgi:NifU-like protein involved in Fe-S cluster formation
VVLYSERVTEFFDHPRGRCADEELLSGLFGEAGAVADGVQVQFRMGIRGQQITAIGFRAYGCPHTIAACGLVCEQLQDRPVGSLLEIDAAALQRELEIPVEKAGKILILQDALSNCYQNWKTGA